MRHARVAPTTAALVIFCGLSACQRPAAHVESGPPPAASAPAPAPFPDDWIGCWQGTCVAQYPNGRAMSFAMELRILPEDASDRWSWTLLYGSGEQRQERPYALRCRDPAGGHYEIDEQNSIAIDTFHCGAALYSLYAVEDALIQVTYTRTPAGLEFELVSYDRDAPRITGNAAGIPEVQAYPLRVVQRATLQRASRAP